MRRRFLDSGLVEKCGLIRVVYPGFVDGVPHGGGILGIEVGVCGGGVGGLWNKYEKCFMNMNM